MTLVLPPVIGHRGAAAIAPENTLAAIRAAAAGRVAMVEVDAKLTADGVAILLHDDDLDRTTDGTGPAAARTAEEFARLDAGGWFAPEFAGEPVPTLEAALALVVELGLAINIEIKPCPGREVETAKIVLATAQAAWPAGLAPPLVSSFSLESLEVAARLAPDWPRGYLIWDRPDDWRAVADRLGAASLHVCPDRSTPEEMAQYLAAGRPVAAYTVNDAAAAAALWQAGVAAVFSDDPASLLPR